MINKETIDKIFDAADIVEVVSDFITLKKRGVNYLGLCPFHNEKTPSFTVSPAKGIYKCFGCGKGGNAVNFIMEHEQLSYVETLKWLAKKYHIEIVETEMTEEQKEQKDARESMLIVTGFAQKTFSYNLTETEEGKAVGLSYFKERGFTEKTIKKFELGYCRKERDAFTKLALSKGYKEKYLISTGLTVKRDDGTYFDRFAERVMFPIHNLMGKVTAFGGRTLRTDKKIAKYLNSPESEIYHKSKVLYGIYFAKKSIIQNNKCYLVEGYTDVISMHQAGIENVVASSGTSLTPDQIRLIKRFTPNVTVLYDGDAAGIKAALRGIDLVLEEGMNVKVVLLPKDEDPDSFAKSHSATEFYDFIEQNEADFITFKTKLLLSETKGDPVKKSQLIGDIVRTIAVIPDGITRALYVKECAGIMSIDEKILHSEINKILYKKREERWKKQQKVIPPNPSGQPLNTQLEESDKFEKFEKEIIRLLLLYGDKTVFRILDEDKKNYTDVLAVNYIYEEVKDEIKFQTPEYKIIFDEIKEAFEKGDILDGTYFIHHQNQIVAKIVSNLMAEQHHLSEKLWTKGDGFIRYEKDDLLKVIDNAINGYKYEMVMEILKNIGEKIKQISPSDSDAEEKLTELLNEHIAYTEFKKEISKILGDRIILKY